MKRVDKLLTYIIAISVFIIILALFGIVNIYNSSQVVYRQEESNFFFLTEIVKTSVNKFFKVIKKETEHCREVIEITVGASKLENIAQNHNLSKSPEIKNYMNNVLSPFLLYSASHVDYLTSLYFMFDYNLFKDKHLVGLWYLKTDKGFTSIDNGLVDSMLPVTRPDLKWYYLPKKLKEGVWSDPYIDDDLKIKMISYTTPVYVNKVFWGVTGMDVSLDELYKFIQKINVYKTGQIYILNKDNTIIISKGYNNTGKSAKYISNKLYKFLTEKFPKLSYDKQNGINIVKYSKNIYAVSKLENGFVLVIEVLNSELYGEVTKLVRFIIISLILAILISIYVAFFSYTKVRKINEELIHKEKLIFIGTMTAEIAHEINNPLGYLKCNLETVTKFLCKIKAHITNCEKECKRFLDNEITHDEKMNNINEFKENNNIDFILESFDDLISESKQGIDKLSSIIFNLKNYSRNDILSDKSCSNLKSIINDTIKMLGGKIPSDIKIDVEVDEKLTINCNKIQMQQVLVNIVQNSIQAIEAKGSDDKYVKIRAYLKGNNACIEIEDNGLGIEKNKISKIFDSFYTTKSPKGCTGLGLSISHYIIVKKHNGKIAVESEKGVGSKFIIELPSGDCKN